MRDGNDALRSEHTTLATRAGDPGGHVPSLVAPLDAEAIEAVVDAVEEAAVEPLQHVVDGPEDSATGLSDSPQGEPCGGVQRVDAYEDVDLA